MPICGVLTGGRDPGPAAQPLYWRRVHLEGPACFGHRSGYLQAGLQREVGLMSPVIKIRDLSRSCYSSHLVHMPPSSVSFPRWQGQAGGRASARPIPAWTGSETGMCSRTWGLRSASRDSLLAPGLCEPLGKSLKVTVPWPFRCKTGTLQLSLPVLPV